jgi:zinc-ribbon domain
MRCPKCGNELSREEAFCGQCGAPTLLPARPPETANPPAPRTGGLLRSFNTQAAPPSSPYNPNPAPPSSPYNIQPAPPSNPNHPGMMPPAANSYNLGTPPPSQPLPTRPPAPGPVAGPGQPPFPPRPAGPQQPNDFYQDATEAMIVSPPNGNPNYPQQRFLQAPLQGGYPGTGAYGPPMQPFQAGSHTGPGYPLVQAFPSGQGYGYGMQPNAAQSQKQRGNSFLVIVCVLFVIAFLIAAGVGTLYLLRNQSSQAAAPAATPVPQATTIPSPTPSPVPTSTPTPIATPSPTLTPSPAPDPGFTFCDESCTTNGYSVEYPSTWQQGTTSDNTGVEFKSPKAPDEYAAFKATASTGSDKASDLVNNDLQNNFASRQDYAAPSSLQSTTIGGVTWVYSVATYTLNGQMERIEVYATVRQGRDYIIELQAPDGQFDQINSRYFVTMLGNFQFQSGTT